MGVLVVETYVVRAEKLDDYDPALSEFLDFKDHHPDLFAGLISWHLWKQEYVVISDLYVEMWEYESLAEMERLSDRIFADEGMKKIGRNFHQLIEPASFSSAIWFPVV